MPKKATKQSADVVARIDAQIQGVIAEIDTQLAQLEEKKAALLNLFGSAGAVRRGRPPAGAKAAAPAKKRTVSAATRKKLKESKKAYWAKFRAEKAKAEKAEKTKAQKAAA